MKQLYPLDVSEKEFLTSTPPSRIDQAAVACSMGMMFGVQAPILQVLHATAESTPNARLRWVLSQAYRFCREYGVIGDPMSAHPDILDEDFMEAVITEERTRAKGAHLLDYAYKVQGTPHRYLAVTIGRLPYLSHFTTTMHAGILEGIPIVRCLERLCRQRIETLDESLHRILERYKKDPHLCVALDHEPAIFDPIYRTVVKAGEMNTCLKRAFELLSLP